MLKISTRIYAAGVMAATLAGVNLNAHAAPKVNVTTKVTKVAAHATVNGKAVPVKVNVKQAPTLVKTTSVPVTAAKTVSKIAVTKTVSAKIKPQEVDEMADCCKDDVTAQ